MSTARSLRIALFVIAATASASVGCGTVSSRPGPATAPLSVPAIDRGRADPSEDVAGESAARCRTPEGQFAVFGGAAKLWVLQECDGT